MKEVHTHTTGLAGQINEKFPGLGDFLVNRVNEMEINKRKSLSMSTSTSTGTVTTTDDGPALTDQLLACRWVETEVGNWVLLC